MLIGIISDTHDDLENLDKALKILKQKGTKALIHCGDFCAPFVINSLAKAGLPVHCVFGNTDDRYHTAKKCDEAKNITLHGELAELELDGKKIAVTHRPEFAEGLAYTGKYDIVVYGHNHQKAQKKIGQTLLVNPGELGGKLKKASFAVYNTKTNEVEFFAL